MKDYLAIILSVLLTATLAYMARLSERISVLETTQASYSGYIGELDHHTEHLHDLELRVRDNTETLNKMDN